MSGDITEKHAKPSNNFKEIFTDGKSHLITLVLDYDGSYEILIDQNSVNSGLVELLLFRQVSGLLGLAFLSRGFDRLPAGSHQ